MYALWLWFGNENISAQSASILHIKNCVSSCNIQKILDIDKTHYFYDRLSIHISNTDFCFVSEIPFFIAMQNTDNNYNMEIQAKIKRNSFKTFNLRDNEFKKKVAIYIQQQQSMIGLIYFIWIVTNGE